MSDMWTTIAAERGALADDLADLSPVEWNARSICDGWTVEDVLAHLTSAATLTPPTFLLDFAASGFNFPRFADKGIARQKGGTPAETLAKFRSKQHSTKSPPGPKLTWLGETIVHADDIRRPLGIHHAYPTEAVQQVLDFYKNSNTLIGTKNRIAGLTLKATDTDWTHGSGPTVEGPILSLLVASTGRSAALSDLDGDGVATLRERSS
jgi:uncharacterized protein (TIGR03083 family)